MRLLFVDDEPEILAGLRRLLYDIHDDWDIHFAASGAEGLALMAEAPFDVLVTDMRMPHMDGVRFLELVQRDFPNTIRIVLSGQTDEGTAVRALKVAHQFLAKPFEPTQFCEFIEQTATLTRLLRHDSMRELLGNFCLPPAPKLYHELSTALENPETSGEDIVALVQRDPTMTVKLLQLANSAFFARRTPTADLRSAVTHLGMNTIRHLVLTVEVFDTSGTDGRMQRELDVLREKAICMAKIAEKLSHGGPLRTEAFTMGLLADIGQVTMALTKGEEWSACRKDALNRRKPLHEVEYERFRVSHAEVGGFLLGIWGLPFSVVEAVTHHHRPAWIAAPVMGPAAIAAIAAAIVDGFELDGDWLAHLGAAARVDEVRREYCRRRTA